MNIKIKYGLSERVFVMHNNRILNQYINNIDIVISRPQGECDGEYHRDIVYNIRTAKDVITPFRELNIYSSREDLIKSL